MKRYSKRDFLDLFPEREPSKRLFYHDIRDDGVYLRMPDEFENRVGLTEIPIEHPTGEPGKPALPFPFTLLQFLHFERTAGLVAEMSDDEVRALSVRNLNSYELARTARDEEAANELLPDLERQRANEYDFLEGFESVDRARGRAPERTRELALSIGRHPLAYWRLPDGRTVYKIRDALNVTAAAIHPGAVDDGSSFADALRFQVTRDEQLKALERAVGVGAVTILNSTTLTPMVPLSGDALERASIARDELQRFARVHLRIALRMPEDLRQQEARRAAGRYTLEEAANEIARQAAERADVMLEKLMKAAQAGELPVYEPDHNARYVYGEGGASHVREFYEEAFASDLNKWLAEHEPRIPFRFSEETGTIARVADAPQESLAPTTPVETAPALDSSSRGRAALCGRTYRLQSRRDDLWPAIDKARQAVDDPTDHAAVWAKFVIMANSDDPPAPLCGTAEGEIKYETADGIKTISRSAFIKRLKRTHETAANGR